MDNFCYISPKLRSLVPKRGKLFFTAQVERSFERRVENKMSSPRASRPLLLVASLLVCIGATAHATFVPGAFNSWTQNTAMSTTGMPPNFKRYSVTANVDNGFKLLRFNNNWNDGYGDGYWINAWNTVWSLPHVTSGYDDLFIKSPFVNGRTMSIVTRTDNSNETEKFGFMMTSGTPRTISSVSGGTGTVAASTAVSIDIVLSAAKHSEEFVLVRYTRDGFANSSFVTATLVSGSTYRATIPASANATTGTVTWYAMTSTVETPSTDTDFLTLTLLNNSGSNYSYTVANVPTVTTPTAASIATTSATLGGNVTSNGGAALSSRGTVWGTSAAPTSNALAEGGTTTGVFTHSRTGLTANTLYTYRAYAVNGAGTGYSADANFTTLPLPPTVGTGSSATTSGFTANWSHPTMGAVAYTYTVEVDNDSAFGSIDATVSSISSANTSQAITGLNAGTTYYYRVRAVNATGASANSSTSAGIATSAASAVISSSGTPAALSTTYGTASSSTSFSVSGTSMAAGILVTPPSGFQVSTDNSTFSSTVTVGSSGTISSTTVYVRLASTTVPGTYSGNIVLSSSGATSVNVATTASTVNTKALTISSAAVTSKVYDRTTSATITGSLSGVNGLDTVTLSGTGTFNTAAVGTGKAVTSTSTLGGAQASYYTLTQPTGLTGTITAAPLTVSGASATNRVYNRTTTVSVSGGSLSGVISGDTVTLGGTPTGSVATAAVGTGKAVTVTGYSVTGTDSGNYSLTQPSLTVNITAAPLTVTGATATDRVYNALTTITVSGGSLSGVISGDTVTLGGTPTGSVATATVGSGKAVTVTGYSISGADSGNYSLTQPSLTVNITKATPSVTVNPTASGIKYGRPLSSSTFSGGTVSPSGGTWAWTSPSTIPAPGTASYSATFTPTDTTNYNNATANVSLTVQMAQSRNTGGSSSPNQPSAIYLGDTNRTFGAETWGDIDGDWGRGRLFIRHSNSNLVGGVATDWGTITNANAKTFSSTQFTNTGTWFWGIQMDYGGNYGTNFWHKISTNNWTDMSTNGDASTLSVTVQAIPTPSGVNFSGVSSTQMTLNWTKATNAVATGGYDVLVLRHTNSGFTEEPTNGTAYSTGNSIGGATVVYKGGDSNIPMTGLTAGTTYYFKVYSENYSYYSSAVSTNAATTGTPSITIGGATNATATAFTTTYGAASASQQFTIAGSNLTANITATAPTGFELSTNGTSGWASTASFTQTSGSASGTLHVRLSTNAPVTGSYDSQNITLASTGATTRNITTAGTGNSVARKTLRVTVGSQNVFFGYPASNNVIIPSASVLAQGSFTVNTNDLVNNDGTNVVTGTPVYSTTYVQGDAHTVTNRAVTIASGLSASNYSISPTAGTVTILPLGDPTSFTATKQSDTQVNTAWSRFTSNSTTFNVMLVRREGSAVTLTPSNGVAYTNNQVVSGNTVLLGSAAQDALNNTNLTANTTYHYRIFSENWSYYSPGATASATTDPTPPSLTASANSLVSFGNVIVGTNSTNQSYTISGANLTNNVTVSAPTDFLISTNASSGFTNSFTLAPASGTVASTTVFVRFVPGSSGAKSGSITNATGGASSQLVSVSGAGVNRPTGTDPATANATIAYLGDTVPLSINASTTFSGTNRSFAAVFARFGNADLTSGALENTNNPGSSATLFTIDTPRLTNTGIFYWAMRVSYGFGNDFWFDASRPTATALSFSAPTNSPLAITVTNLVDPSSVSATSITTNSLTLNWTRGVSGGSTKDTLVLRRADASFTDPTQGAQYNSGGSLGTSSVVHRGDSNSITQTGLSPGTTYHYKLYAENWSYYSPGTTFSVTTVPSAPAAPTGSAVTASNFTATWANPGSATNYFLDVSTASNFATFVSGYSNKAVATLSDSITGLSANTTYYVRVRAQNSGGTSANSASLTQLTAPAAPAKPSASSVLATSFNVTWAGVTGATGYRLDVDDNEDFSSPLASYNNKSVATTSDSVTGLTADTTYYVRVRAVNGGGTGDSSPTLTAATAANATAPVITEVTPGNGQLSVAFTAGEAGGLTITNYEYSTDNGSTYTAVSPTSTESPIVITGLTNGTNYTVRIRAVNSDDSKGSASGASSATPRTTPGAPTGLTVTAANTQLTANFTVPSDNGGSAITNYEYSLNGGSSFTAVSPASTSTSITITGLTNGTSYDVQVRAVNAAGSGVATSTVSATPRTSPTVTTGAPSSVAAYSAALAGNITATGGNNPSMRGFEYSTTNNFVTNTGTRVSSTGDFSAGAFTNTATNLASATTYYYRAFASNSAGISYGAQSNFTTLTVPGGKNPATANATTAVRGDTVRLDLDAWQTLNGTNRSFATVFGRYDNADLSVSSSLLVQGAGRNPGSSADGIWADTPQLTNAGTFYWTMRVSYGSGNDYWFDASRPGWSDLALDRPSAATLSIVVSNPSNPTGVSATALSSTNIRVDYTKWSNRNVLIVRKAGSEVTWSPTQGTIYTDNQSVGDGHVVLRGSRGAEPPFLDDDTPLQPGTTYHYKVFSENFRYYSDGATATATTAGTPTITISGSTNNVTTAAFTTTFGTPSASQSFTIGGSNLTTNIVATAPTGFQVSTNDSTFTNSVSFAQSSGTASGTLFLRLSGSANAGDYNSASVNLASTDATTRTITTPTSGNTIAKATPTISAMPSVSSSIMKGDTLSNGLLSGGTANVGGTFSFGDTNRQTATGDKAVTFTPTDTTNYANVTNNVSVTVDAVPDPTSVTATSGGTNSIALTHTRTSNRNVMIVRRTGSAVDWVPTEGTTYANGFTTNGHTVVHGSLAANSSTNSGLSASTTYHYRIFSENWGYYSPGVTTSATTDALPPSVSVSGTPAAMTTTYGTASSASQFSVSGANLTASMSVAAPAGFEVSLASGTGFASSVTLSPTSGTVSSTTIYVRLKSNASPGANSGNVTVASTGATTQNVAVSGTVNIPSMTMNVSSSAGSLNGDYGATKLFADEVAGTSNNVTITFNAGVVADEVEIWTNLNNRDRADDDANSDGIPDGIVPPDPIAEKPSGYVSGPYPSNGYFQAYPMALSSGTSYTLTLNANKTGAYRVSARYRMAGGPWVWFNDALNGLNQKNRDHAITVTPVLARNMNVYEINTLNVNATGSTFEQRSTFESLTNSANGRVNLDYLRNLGVNTLWFQPVHPNGISGREPSGGWNSSTPPYDPGSPYSVKNFFEVMEQMSQGNSRASSMVAFTNFVAAADSKGVHVMLDAPFNHTSYDVEFGQKGLEVFAAAGISTNGWGATNEIRNHEARFFSRNDGANAYNGPASSAANAAVAPDRNDFGKWRDVLDVFFGRYSTLVTGNPSAQASRDKVANTEDTINMDDLKGTGDVSASTARVTRAVWQYFAAYVPYWLEKTGLPANSSLAEQATKGVDGLRADFGQGMPPQFWEYAINVAREHKWSFVFMTESLDGGLVTYRSNRHFDILNENIVFPWKNAANTTAHRTIFEDRRNSYGDGLVLLNNTSHDEAGYADPWEAFIRYAVGSTIDGAPMIMYGQEIGTGAGTGANSGSFDWFEFNFEKWIPHFKRYNSMEKQWAAWNTNSFGVKNLMPNYSGVGKAREFSAALRSTSRWFLNPIGSGTADPNIFAVAKYETANASPATSDVVLAFVNLNRNSAEDNTFGIPSALGTLLGIEPNQLYNVKNIAAYLGPNNELPNRRSQFLWPTPRLGSDIIANGIYVGLNAVPSTDAGWTNAPYEAQYLKVYVAPGLTTGGSPSAVTTIYGSASTNTSFTLTANNVHDGVTVTAPAGFQVSTNASSGFASSFSLTNTGTIGSTTVFARLAATNPVGTYSGNVTIASPGGTNRTVALPASTVTAKALTITGATATSRAFNGSTNVTVSGGTLVGIVGSDAVTVAGTPAGTMANANAGTNKPVTVTGYALSGAAAANYTVTQPTDVTVTITPVTPTIAAAPMATAITEGQALSASTLSGGSVTGVGGAAVSGNFAFTTPAAVPAVGTANQSVTFTPSDANYGTVVGAASVTVNPAALPLPEGTKFSVSTNGVYTVVGSNDQPIEGATFTYLYRGRTNDLSGFNTNYAFMTYSNSNAPTAPGFYRVTATAGGNYTGTVIENYAIAGPLLRDLSTHRAATAVTNNLTRSTLLSSVQRVTTNSSLSTGTNGLTWTNPIAGFSTMANGASNANSVSFVGGSIRLFVTNTNSISDTLSVVISDGFTPITFPVTVIATNGAATNVPTLTTTAVSNAITPVTNGISGTFAAPAGAVTNVPTRMMSFMARPNRPITIQFRNPTNNQWYHVTATNVPFVSATNQPLTNAEIRPAIFTPRTGVIRFLVDTNLSGWQARPAQ